MFDLETIKKSENLTEEFLDLDDGKNEIYKIFCDKWI